MHWRKKAVFVAFSLRVEVLDVTVGGPESAPSGPYLFPTTGYDSQWSAESRYRYYSGSVIFPGTPPSGELVYVDGEWVGVLSEIVVNGLPDLEDGSAGHAFYGRFVVPPITGGVGSPSRGRWIDPAGEELAIPVPGNSGLNFIEGAPAASVFGPTFGAPAGYELEEGSGLYTYLAPYGSDTVHSEFAIVAGVTVSYEGAVYEPFAARAVPFTRFGIAVGDVLIGPGETGAGTPHQLWVLCRKIET